MFFLTEDLLWIVITIYEMRHEVGGRPKGTHHNGSEGAPLPSSLVALPQFRSRLG
jgi:hypothetical protein